MERHNPDSWPGIQAELGMKIVILDSFPTNAGDLDWSPLAVHCEVVTFESTAPSEVVDRCAGAQIVLTNKVALDAATIASLPDLRMIQVLATGYNVVDVAAAKRADVTVCNVPAYSTASVAQHAIALLLALTNRVETHAASVNRGEWTAGGVWSYWNTPLLELDGKTLGIIGFGAIGSRVAKIADALGMKILVAERVGRSCSYPQAPLEALFQMVDAVTLHCPLSPATQNLINADRLSRMKPTSYVINTGRGPLIDESALAQALRDGTIAGAALDVLSKEPPLADNPLIGLPNCLITPHHAWASFAARSRMVEVIFRNVGQFMSGHPQNVVS